MSEVDGLIVAARFSARQIHSDEKPEDFGAGLQLPQ
jgi:hypothetical protein